MNEKKEISNEKLKKNGEAEVVIDLLLDDGKYNNTYTFVRKWKVSGKHISEKFDVYKNGGINAIIFKIEKKPQRVYFGDWGEFKNMQIYWESDDCLVINSVEYSIE